MKFLQLTGINGKKIIVNAENIDYVIPDGKHTRICCSGSNYSLKFKENADHIFDALQNMSKERKEKK